MPPSARSYWQLSRSPRYSVLFALPLLLLYEGLAAAYAGSPGGDVRNGADVILRSLFSAVAGPQGPLLLGACLVGGSIWLVARDMRNGGGRLEPGMFVRMFAEAVVFGLLFGVVVGTVTAQVLAPFARMSLAPDSLGFGRTLMVSLGAGLYEELVFRVLLVSGLVALGRMVFGWRPAVAGTVAVVVSALVFSAFHYIGPFGDPFAVDSFTFRAVGGLAFSALYVTRGFGITAWSHALYDVFLLLL